MGETRGWDFGWMKTQGIGCCCGRKSAGVFSKAKLIVFHWNSFHLAVGILLVNLCRHSERVSVSFCSPRVSS